MRRTTWMSVSILFLATVLASGCSQVNETLGTPANTTGSSAGSNTGTGGASSGDTGSGGSDVNHGDGGGSVSAMGTVSVEISAEGCGDVTGVTLDLARLVAVDAEGGMHEVGMVQNVTLSCSESGLSFTLQADLPAGDYTGLILEIEGGAVHMGEMGDVPFGPKQAKVMAPFSVSEGGELTLHVALNLQVSFHMAGGEAQFNPVLILLGGGS